MYGQITATDIPKRPVVYYHEYMEDSLLTCTSYDNNESIFACMDYFNVTDTIFVEIGSLDYENLNCSILQYAATYIGMGIDPQCEGTDLETIQGIILQPYSNLHCCKYVLHTKRAHHQKVDAN